MSSVEIQVAVRASQLLRRRSPSSVVRKIAVILGIGAQVMTSVSAYAQNTDVVNLPPLPPSLQSSVQAGQGSAATGTAAPSGVAFVRRPDVGKPSLNAPGVLDASNSPADPTLAVSPSKGDDADEKVRKFRQPAKEVDPPTALQQFVKNATGQMLPIFGQNLFTDGENQSYVPVQNVPAPADYVIGPGDEVVLHVWGGVDGDVHQMVDRNGQITIPKIGAVKVAGVKASDLNNVLKGQVGRVYTNFGANASLGRLRSIQVYVVGKARHPGAYTVSSLSTLVNALFASGGPEPNGSMRRIELRRDGALVATLDLYDFITQGKATGDVHLQPGDVIVIPSAGPRVALLGALDTPAIYELKSSDERLQQLLTYAGGVTALTGRSKVLIERIDPAQAKAPRTVEEVKLDATGLASTVKDGDVITLFEIRPKFANAVTLRGNVAEPLRYPYKDGMTLADLLPDPDALLTPGYFTRKNILVQYDRPKHIGRLLDQTDGEVRNLVEQPNWNYAVIERLDPKDLSTKLIPFNLGDVVLRKDPKANLALEPGDVVTIFGTKDMRLPIADQTRLVRLDGEVRAAGVYELRPGDTLQTVLRRAGGTSPQAYLYGLEFTREQTRKDQQRNLDAAISRAERQASSRLATALANVPSTDSKVVQDQIVAAQQAEIKTLHSLKPNGRISLELPTTANRIADLPDVPLEDGDAVYVPPMPSYVMVVGAVDNENAQLWAPGRTVRDALRASGVQRDVADTSAAFVLRADGSVTRMGSEGWFHSFDSIPLMPGDTIVMPEKLDRRSSMTKFVAGLKDWSQVLANFGLGAAAIKVLK